LALTLMVVVVWGANSFFVKLATETGNAESIFAYMALGSLLLIPFVAWEVGVSAVRRVSFAAIGLTASIHLLNALGVWTSIYAYRYGKAIIVSPCVNALYPAVTVTLSLLLQDYVPPWYVDLGIFICMGSVLIVVAGDARLGAGR